MEDALVATLTVQNSHTIFRVSFEFLNFMGLHGTSRDVTGHGVMKKGPQVMGLGFHRNMVKPMPECHPQWVTILNWY